MPQRLGAYRSAHERGWRPRDLPGCRLWLRADRGITITELGALTTAGTSPPAATFTGVPAATVRRMMVEITTGGDRGTALFKWSSDGGLSYTTGVTTAATVALGATGITVNFPVGTYATDNVYSAYPGVGTWADQSINGNDLTQATTAQKPAYIPAGGAGPNSLPSLLFTRTLSTYLEKANVASINPSSLCLTVAVKPTDNTGEEVVCGNSYQITHYTNGNCYGYLKTNSNSLAVAVTLSSWVILTLYWDGTTGANSLRLYKNGAIGAQAASSQSSFTAGVFNVGKGGGVATASYFGGEIAEVVLSPVLGNTDRHNLELYLGQRYGVAIT